MTTASIYTGVTYVIPCSGQKLDHAAPARDLYTGSMFRNTLAAAEHEAAEAVACGAATEVRILILSARYGLVELDTVIEPYEQRMDQPGAVTPETIAAQAEVLGIGWDDDIPCGEVYGLLPAAYDKALYAALTSLDVYPMNVYEAAPGIGYQRAVLAHIRIPVPHIELPKESPMTSEAAPATRILHITDDEGEKRTRSYAEPTDADEYVTWARGRGWDVTVTTTCHQHGAPIVQVLHIMGAVWGHCATCVAQWTRTQAETRAYLRRRDEARARSYAGQVARYNS